MPPPTSRLNAPLDWLLARQWRDEHGHLLQRTKSQETKVNAIGERVNTTLQASNAATRDVDQLRRDLESYMNDPNVQERNARIHTILTEHNDELASLRKSANSWRPLFESCQNELTQVEEAADEKIKDLSDRLVILENQNTRLGSLGAQVNTMQFTLDTVKKTCQDQATDIMRLEKALVEARNESVQRQAQVPRSPTLPLNDSPNRRLEKAPTRREATTEVDDQEYLHSSPTNDLDELASRDSGNQQSRPRKKPRLSPGLDTQLEGEKLRQMMQPELANRNGKHPAPSRSGGTEMNDSNFEATQRVRQKGSRTNNSYKVASQKGSFKSLPQKSSREAASQTSFCKAASQT
ncbi:hypothetical protein P280DRAFT_523564 [Massarina eburnea CBS 473.64]|uniref:Uncharacterized protein n=1 Tax=Massarina eburnea CBS 473.64 TaxID=1395130 RepID=A0A6A6RIR1_9PLEO|nr:hypothetical protein P280DRAFT_523564 [Massarina eburnea CBS 473.64]